MRVDKFLWFVRVVKTRGLAQQLAETGHLRIDGRRIERAHCEVRPGQVLSFPIHDKVKVLRIESLPVRRGSPAEARQCYTDLSDVPAG